MTNIYDYTDYRSYLIDLYVSKQGRNSSYSANAYARQLGMSPSLFSEVRRHEDNMGLAVAERIAKRLKLTTDETLYLQELIRARKSGSLRVVHKLREIYQYEVINKDAASRLYQDDFVIFVKMCILRYLAPTVEAAAAMGRDPEYLWQACDRLTENGYLDGCREKGWTTELSYVLSLETKQKNNRAYHREYFLRAAEAFHQSPEERFFFSVVRSLSRAEYDLVCQRIHDFLMDVRLSDSVEAEHDMVYVLGAQLIPMDSILRPNAQK